MNFHGRPTRRAVVGVSLAALLLAATGLAAAQAFPSRTVTIVVPFPPVGGADTPRARWHRS